MSSSPTERTSTTHSSISCSSRSEPRVALIACGALAGHARDIARSRGWQLQVHALPAGLHNRPAEIAPAVEALAARLQARGLSVVLGYADCGSYGALDELCERLGLRRLPGLHCYDVLGGAARIRALLAREPGTYLLTDYLVATFGRTVLAGLGLDRHPELWADYFRHYRCLAWLAQDRTPALEARARAIADVFGLPLRVVDTGTTRLARELELLVGGSQ